MSDDAQRITFVSHTNKPGGGELALRRYLAATQVSVRLVTLEAGGVWDGVAADVVAVDSLWSLRRALRGEVLVVANSMRSAFLTSLVLPKGVGLAYWVRDGLTDSAMTRPALWLTRFVTARRSRHYLANSRWTASTVVEALGVPAVRVDVVPSLCGIEDEPPEHQASSRPRDPLRLLYLGRIAKWKAPHIAVEALARLRKLGVDATLTIAGGIHFGEAAYGERLARMAAAEPGVELRGHIDDVRELLRSHDVLAHCSTTPEPFGQVIVQALHQGVPVVATNAGGPVDVLQGAPISLLYPPGDGVALAETISRVVMRYPELSQWSRSRARAFSDSEAVRRTDEALRAILHSWMAS